MRQSFRASILALVAVPALAQQDVEGLPSEETVDPIRRYTVELIIFAYGEGIPAGNEIWLPDEPGEAPHKPIIDFFDMSPFADPDEALTEIDPPEVGRLYMDVGLTPLDPDSYTLNEIYDKLVELDAYEPIMRAAWTQDTFEKALTAPLQLRTLDDPPTGLDGSVTLYRGRFLHFVVDLSLDANFGRLVAEAETTHGIRVYGDARVQAEHELFDEYGEPLPPPIRYRISEDRIMRNGDIRYFDHPRFGAIAKVTRVEEIEAEIFDDTDDLLPGN
ncbi:MAG: CsiV family protein [Woeseiaceae bacterium]